MAKEKITKTVGTDKTDEGRERALATAMAQIEKQYGKGAVMKLGENASMNVEHISTGSMALDMLFDKINGKEVQSVSLPMNLIIRDSVTVLSK